jgi:spermidine synthase
MNGQVFRETLHDGLGQEIRIDEVLFESDTGHQRLSIFRNAKLGRVLTLDGVVQTTEADEFIYHEMLAHTPILAHGNVSNVLIIGGGDGGMLREVLKHPELRATQVEIDQGVIDLSREYLPNHSAGAFDNPRADIVIADGMDFVRETDDRFDVIISDSTDPIGPGEVLFTEDFYALAKRCLEPGGILVTQNGVPFVQMEEVLDTHRRMAPHFTDMTFYSAAVPTYYGGVMTFGWGSDDRALRQVSLEVLGWRFSRAGLKTRYYNPAVHKAAFALPQFLVDALEQEA